MKDKLTPEQSNRLIELGVDPSKASSQYIYMEQGYGLRDLFQAPVAQPIFDLSDILALLPRIIKYSNRVCRLKFQAIVSIHDGLSEVWQACYTHTSCKTNKEASELIDALFELLCWVLINHPKSIKQKQ